MMNVSNGTFKQIPILQHGGLFTTQPYKALFQRIYYSGGIICGGFPRCCVTTRTTPEDNFGDFDIYPKDEVSYKKLLGMYEQLKYIREIDLLDTSDPNDQYPFKVTTLHINLPSHLGNMRNDYLSKGTLYNTYRFQIIKLFIDKYSSVEEFLLKEFDLSVCQAYLDYDIDYGTAKIFVGPKFEEDDFIGRIRFMNYREIKNSKDFFEHMLSRIQKYMNKGYAISMKEFNDLLAMLPDEFTPDHKIRTLKWLAGSLGNKMDMYRLNAILDVGSLNISLA